MKQKKPAYLTLYESLREEIVSGIRPCGSRLPSRRMLARDRGVSAVTAEHSIELLCEEGYAESRPRSGCYVIYRESDGFTLPSVQSEPLFRAVLPSPDRNAFPFPALARIMRRVLSEYGEKILIRPPHTGCPELRNALCSYLARNRGIRVQADQIVIGAGAEYLYGLVVELLGSGRIYGVEAPSYQKIEQVYRSRHPFRSASDYRRLRPAYHTLPQFPQRRHRHGLQTQGVPSLGGRSGPLYRGGRL